MKRIFCLIDSLGPGGAQRQLVGLAVFLKQQGHDVSVLCYHDNRFYVDTLLSKGVPYILLNKAKKASLRIWHIAKYLRKRKPDVLIAYQETPSVCACVAHILNRKFRLIVSERSTTQHTGRQEKIRFFLYRWADAIVPNSYTQSSYIAEKFPNLKEKVVTISNFVDLDYFEPGPVRLRNEVAEILVVATLWPLKNALGLIEVTSLLKKRGFQFHISWYGKDSTHLDYFDQCQKKISELGVDDYIELKEKTTAIKEKYQTSDYFCLPSFYEGTPNVICEAMSCGLPVACSDVCDNSRFVKEGENGFLFNPKDVNNISDALERMLLLNEDDYQGFCRNSRKRAEEMLSKDRFVQSYIKLIEQ